MFSVLVSEVFPVLGEFFGKLVAVSNLPVADFIAQFNITVDPIMYTNYFNGLISSFTILPQNGTGAIVGATMRPLLSFLFLGVPRNLSLWLSFLISFTEVYLSTAMIKFIKGLF